MDPVLGQRAGVTTAVRVAAYPSPHLAAQNNSRPPPGGLDQKGDTMTCHRLPLCPEVLEQLGLDGYEPEPCELPHLAVEQYEPYEQGASFVADSALGPVVGIDGSTPYEP